MVAVTVTWVGGSTDFCVKEDAEITPEFIRNALTSHRVMSFQIEKLG